MKRQLRVLYISARADIGGGPNHVDILINNLPDSVSVFIACPNEKPYFEKWENNPKVKGIFIIPHRSFSFVKLLHLSIYCVKNKISIIHSNGKGAGVYSRLIKILTGVKVIHTYHGVHINEYTSIQKFIYFTYERIFSLFTSHFISVSNGELQICLDNKLLKKRNATVIYNSINQPIANNAFLPEIDALKNKTIIVTLSRFDVQKNMSLGIEIASKLLNRDDIYFLWIGDGPEKKELEEKAKANNLNIIFTGFKNNPQDYLFKSQIYLSTSRWEGLPYAMIEAISTGLPIVCTNVVGNNEITIDNYNGFLFDITNGANQACKLITDIVDNKELYAKFSKNSLLMYEDFKVENMIENYLKVYNMLLK